MTKQAAPIGVFDSGFGGLSVMRSIRRELPQEDLAYVSDGANAPYGDRPPEFIAERTVAIGRWLESQGCKAIAVACNTATTVAIGALRQAVSIPVVGIEPGVKPAAAMTRTGTIAVMATTRTLTSGRYQELVRRFASRVTVLSQPCPGLVEFVESGRTGTAEAKALVHRYVAPLVAAGADTICLACTHYPFLADLIAAEAPQARIFEPGPAVARYLRQRLADTASLAVRAEAGREAFWASGASAARQAVCARLWGRELTLSELPL